jgi:hypothetical protein
VGFAEGRFPYAHFTLATVPEPGEPKSTSAIERMRAVG